MNDPQKYKTGKDALIVKIDQRIARDSPPSLISIILNQVKVQLATDNIKAALSIVNGPKEPRFRVVLEPIAIELTRLASL
jgi:hypothetical protein